MTHAQTQDIVFTSSEVAHRIAVVRRLKGLLEEQREHFRRYLAFLDAEGDAIEQRDTASIFAQVDAERRIVATIVAFEKTIRPVEQVYLALYPDRNQDIERLKAAVEKMRQSVLAKNESNRLLLRTRLTELRERIEGMKKPIRRAFAEVGAAGIPDVELLR